MLDKINYEAIHLSSTPWKAIRYILLFLIIEAVTVAYGVIVFILLYHICIPTVELERTLNLVFDTNCNVQMEYSNICSFPTANFSISEGGVPLLTPKYPYMLLLDMWLPDSVHNRNAGMSIITLELYGRDGVLLKQFRKPFSLPYRSDEVRKISNILFAPLYILGKMKEEIPLEIEMSSTFQLDMVQPVLEGRVILESKRYLWSSLALKIQTALSGLSNILYYYPQISFLVTVSAVILLMNMIYVTLVIICLFWGFFNKMDIIEVPEPEDDRNKEDQLHGEIRPEDISL
ncbi:unnamed protein product [Heterobilharzia americana]|nr:unnamed protein product [Heterobilharzia americana]CAH8526042.1 unnamed protein product [Heterobilharzia americana]